MSVRVKRDALEVEMSPEMRRLAKLSNELCGLAAKDGISCLVVVLGDPFECEEDGGEDRQVHYNRSAKTALDLHRLVTAVPNLAAEDLRTDLRDRGLGGE